ncbi:unnamed protein product, partial [Prorocentrum cordatum]
LQRCDQRVREGRAVAAGACAAVRDVGGKAAAQLISYSVGISACEKGEQWQRALALLSEMKEVKLEPNDFSYSAGVTACEKGGQWQQALSILRTVRLRKLDVDFMAYGNTASMCEQGGQWSQALALLGEVRDLVTGE